MIPTIRGARNRSAKVWLATKDHRLPLYNLVIYSSLLLGARKSLAVLLHAVSEHVLDKVHPLLKEHAIPSGI